MQATLLLTLQKRDSRAHLKLAAPGRDRTALKVNGGAGWVGRSQPLEQTGGGWRGDMGPERNQAIESNGGGKRQPLHARPHLEKCIGS